MLAGTSGEAYGSLAHLDGPHDGARDFFFGQALGFLLALSALNDDGGNGLHARRNGLGAFLVDVVVLDVDLGGQVLVTVQQIARLYELRRLIPVSDGHILLESTGDLSGLV